MIFRIKQQVNRSQPAAGSTPAKTDVSIVQPVVYFDHQQFVGYRATFGTIKFGRRNFGKRLKIGAAKADDGGAQPYSAADCLQNALRFWQPLVPSVVRPNRGEVLFALRRLPVRRRSLLPPKTENLLRKITKNAATAV